MTTQATVAPAPPARRFADALPSRRRVALAVALLFAPVALWRFGYGAEGLVGVLFFAHGLRLFGLFHCYVLVLIRLFVVCCLIVLVVVKLVVLLGTLGYYPQEDVFKAQPQAA